MPRAPGRRKGRGVASTASPFYLRAMPSLEMIELYPSPYSERLRWVLESKGLSYARTPYVPIASDSQHLERTGIDTAPVLLADGEVIGDSDVAVDWIEERHPTPALLPIDPRPRAQARTWELVATEVIAPAGRLAMIGRMKAMGTSPPSRRARGAVRGVAPAIRAGRRSRCPCRRRR